MKSLILSFFIISISLFVMQCNENTPPVIVDQDNGKSEIIQMTNLGLSQFFYSFELKKIVKSNAITEWDLKFSCGNDFNISLNTGKKMRIAKVSKKFEAKYDQTQFAKWEQDCIFDNDLQILALANWGDFSFSKPQSYQDVYLLDRGKLLNNKSLGFIKFQILNFQNNSYTIRYGQLDDIFGDTILVPKNTLSNNIYLSFDNGGKVKDIEPHTDNWDFSIEPKEICIIANQTTGKNDTTVIWTDFVNINNKSIQVYCDTFTNYDAININQCLNYPYQKFSDYIGNRWRVWNEAKLSYQISTYNVYIFKKNDIFTKLIFKTVDKANIIDTKIGFVFKELN